VKKYLLYILFFLFSSHAFGQVEMKVIVDNKNVQVGQEVPILIVAKSENPFQIKMPAFDPEKVEVLGYQTSTQSTIDEQGKRSTETNFLLVVRPKTPGALKIGSFLAGQGSDIYKTEPFDFAVNNGTQRENNYFRTPNNQVDIQMKLNRRQVFLNQAAVLVVTAISENMNSLANVRDIKFQPTYGLSYHEVPVKQTDISRIDNRYSIVVAEYLIFASQPGKIDIPPVLATVTQGGQVQNIKSNGEVLNVNPLPKDAPNNFTNAVGEFTSTLNVIGNGDYEINKPVRLQLKLSGTGNLKDLKLPTFKNDKGFRVFKPKVKYDVAPTKEGYKGEVTAEYVVIPEKKGNQKLELEGLSYFDPKAEEYKTFEGESLTMSVENKASEKNLSLSNLSEKASELLAIPKVKKDIKAEQNILQRMGIPLISLIVLIILGSILAYYFYKNKKAKAKKATAKKGESLAAVETSNISEAEEEIRKQQTFDVTAHLEYFRKLIDEKQYEEFFSSFDSMNNELAEHLQKQYSLSVSQYLEQNFGLAFVDEFKKINGKAQMLKYSPFKDSGSIDELYHEINSYYSKFAK